MPTYEIKISFHLEWNGVVLFKFLEIKAYLGQIPLHSRTRLYLVTHRVT